MKKILVLISLVLSQMAVANVNQVRVSHMERLPGKEVCNLLESAKKSYEIDLEVRNSVIFATQRAEYERKAKERFIELKELGEAGAIAVSYVIRNAGALDLANFNIRYPHGEIQYARFNMVNPQLSPGQMLTLQKGEILVEGVINMAGFCQAVNDKKYAFEDYSDEEVRNVAEAFKVVFVD